ncbi:uncharacterized protein LOC124875451 [Girardinichthys multiradiatus]|uniref:uncharacterized protein LOC124875451 n=1 Tax=Girardinichthys multiradiatus TaxID=208333 RepID=UPI001FAD862E|nr:uncharacterized protein LOC124875451 [Girardinichthys multiradiatus]
MDRSHLNPHELKRYYEKIAVIGCDPYEVPADCFQHLSSTDRLPDFSFHDLYIYLIHNPSSYTGESLKAFKSTDAYRYFTAGWVIDPKIWYQKNKKIFLCKAKVNHSQAIIATPTQPWVVVREDGTVLMAHCTCKAGLGEACSHAAALMYALLAAVNVKDGQSSTQKACAWVIPGKTSQIQYEERSKISMTKKNKSKSTTLPSIPVPSEGKFGM